MFLDSFLAHLLGFSSNHVFGSDSELGGTVWVGGWLWVLTGSGMSWEVSVLGVMDIINGFSKNWLSESIELFLGFLDVVLYAISIGIVDLSWDVWFLPVANWLATLDGGLEEFNNWFLIVITVGVGLIERELRIKLDTGESLGL